ncbi:hypothetical protein, partial [Pseudomonas sp. FW305-3-2-15-C-R2A1]|uniref:hypothetical protein n=1 Tax=Pseudomonas sp. FW305-3-2-15-C-R2A1 TaxID=2751333 RepID=UPI001304E3DF
QPVMLESTTHGVEILRAVPLARSEHDLQEGIRLMLKARFSSTAINPEVFLSPRQMDLREAEQKELKNRSIAQEIIFRSAKVTKNEATAEFD